MQALKEWVRSLVLLVLLAGFLEMLLPTGSMKKYVRLTIGLLIVLAIIKPMIGLLGHTVRVDFTGWEPKRGTIPTIDQIMADAGRFREQNWSLALSEARKKVAAEAAQAARTVKGVAQAEATVDLTQQAGELKLVGVTVGVQTGDGTNLVRPVQPVEPVRIGRTPSGGGPSAGDAECESLPSGAAATPTPPASGGGSGGSSTAPAAGGSAPGAVSPASGDPCQAVTTWGSASMRAAERALAEAVRQEVARRLGIPPENQMIRVVVNGGK